MVFNWETVYPHIGQTLIILNVLSFTTCNNNKIFSNKVIQLTLLWCSSLISAKVLDARHKGSEWVPHCLAASSVLLLQANAQQADSAGQIKKPKPNGETCAHGKFLIEKQKECGNKSCIYRIKSSENTV